MKCEIVRKPVVQPVEKVVLTLTLEEALVIKSFAGAVTGSGKVREITDAIYSGIDLYSIRLYENINLKENSEELLKSLAETNL